jgi:hypothetical protein
MLNIPNTPNVSLVAFYGTKPNPLQRLIASLQQQLTQAFADRFDNYTIAQVHATTIGCEGLKTNKGILSKWFLEHRGEEKYIDLSNFLEYIRDRLPIPIRIGGYDPNIDYGFLSQNKHPFIRSFQFIGNVAVLVGWSCQNDTISLDMDRFRLGCQPFNLLHKYHRQPDSIDNDFYMRLGILKEKPAHKEIQAIEREIRDSLSVSSPVHLSIDLESLSFLGYQDLSVPVGTTQVLACKSATEDAIAKFYPEQQN